MLLGWLVGWWLLWRVPWLRGDRDDTDAVGGLDGEDAEGGAPAGPASSAPATVALECTVVIPARNEESSLPNLLASLRRQTVRPGQILVIDDQSDDRTAAIAHAEP